MVDKRKMCRHIRRVMARERSTRFPEAWKGSLRCSVRKRVRAGLERDVPNQSLYAQGQWYDGDTSPGLYLRVLVDNLPTGTTATMPIVSSGRQNNVRKTNHAIYTAVERMIGGMVSRSSDKKGEAGRQWRLRPLRIRCGEGNRGTWREHD